MLNDRTLSPTTVSQRASARRRIRRSTAATRALFCRTNGCATFMELEASGWATCPVCGARARVH